MIESRRKDGFTLVELLLVVSMIGIIASIALPSLSRARAASTEASTIGSLRALNSAQASYATACAGGSYAPSVTWLTKPASGKASFVGPEFAAGDTVNRLGYRFRFTAGTVVATSRATCNGLAAGQAVSSYFIGADPLQTGPSFGIRHFGTNAAATIYQSANRINVVLTGSPPAPAKPLQ